MKLITILLIWLLTISLCFTLGVIYNLTIFVIFGLGCIFPIGLIAEYYRLRWIIWAFENVDDIYELRKYLSKYGWLNSSYPINKQKFLFKSAVINERLDNIEGLFRIHKDEYKVIDNLIIPEETRIYLKKFKFSKLIISVSILILIWIVPLFFYQNVSKLTIIFIGSSTFLILLQVLLIIRRKRKIDYNKPVLYLNDKGIVFNEGLLISWKDLYSDGVEYQSGSNKYYFFTFYDEFERQYKSQKIYINEVDKTEKQIINLIEIYKSRNKRNYR